MPGTTTVGGALRSAVEAVGRVNYRAGMRIVYAAAAWEYKRRTPVEAVRAGRPDRKAEAEALVARLTSGDVRCAHCGGDAAGGWTVCYACCHLPEPELTAPLSPAGERIGPAREARPGG